MTPSIIQPTAVKRQCHINLLADVSSSMTVDGKIGALNFALSETGSVLREFSKTQPQMEMRIQCYLFGGSARRQFPSPVSPEAFQWTNVAAAGGTPFGAAMTLLSEDLSKIDVQAPCYAPVVICAGDGQPNDSWEPALDRFLNSDLGKKSNRIAIAIGDDCDRKMLERFLNGSEFGIISANSTSQIVQAIVTATLRASQASAAGRIAQVSSGAPSLTAGDGGGQQSLFPDVPRHTISPSIIDDPSVENAKW